MDKLIYYWIDLIWVPIMFFGVHKPHRWWALGFVISSIVLIRLMVEVMTYIGYEFGIMGFWDAHVHTRGVIVSSFFYILFLLLAHFSRRTEGVVFMAACLSIFFMIFVVTATVMLL